MSVSGWSFGNESCYIGVARRGGIDLVQNEISQRQNPAMVSFNGRERLLTFAAANLVITNAKNTISQLKRLIGRKFSEPEVQSDIRRLPFTVKGDQRDEILIEVEYNDNRVSFSPQSLLAMVFKRLALTAETANDGLKLADCVISVPPFFTNEQRQAMLDATRIANINCLRLMNENCAVALSYGIYRTAELPETEPLHVMFVDMGHSAFTATLCDFVKGKLTIRSTAYDRNLGGRDLDYALVDHFVGEIKTKYKMDVTKNAKAMIRLTQACEKLKKVLSANAKGNLAIECLMDDKDVAFPYSRDEFEALVAPIIARIQRPIQQVVAESGVALDKLFSVEIIGGSMRVPAVQAAVQAAVGREVSKTLNLDEAVARGCTLQAAMMSPLFKVREFQVNDLCIFPINVSWKSLDDGTGAADSGKAPSNTPVFPANNPIPSSKVVTFKRKTQSGYEISAFYDRPSMLPPGVGTLIGKYSVSKIPAQTGSEPSKVKVRIRLNVHGIIEVDSAQLVEELDEEDTTASPASPAPTTAPGATAGATPMDTSEDKPADGASPAEKKKKIKRTDLTIAGTTVGLNAKSLQQAQELEAEIEAQDRMLAETAAKKNAVESYVYDMRAKFQEELKDFSTPQDQEKFSKLCDQVEDWLYGDGESANKSAYQQKLDELHAVGEPVRKRRAEYENLPIAADALKKAVDEWRALAASQEEKYAHIEAADRQKVEAECAAALDWLSKGMQASSKQPKTTDPTIKAAEIDAKRTALVAVCRPIMTKPKPAPPKVEKKEEPPAPAPADQQTPAAEK
eukprot:TRINITY_DN3305_c0_g1_i1.p1 TRINITY_DN3305_c0_g1~~TRINITY_DN3305_c0_g1_i1.p1  ORF type:complete len:795 (-),score=211.67 TRINITY_DN3305_c0_g1_i1:22-2406(-)